METEITENERSTENVVKEGDITSDMPGQKASLSPRKPDGKSPPSTKDYRVQFNDLRRRYKDLAETSENQKKKALADYNTMNKRVIDLTAEKKIQEAEIERLAVLHEKYKCELEMKESAITTQCDTTEQMADDYKALKEEYERVLKENENLRSVHCAPKLCREEDEEVIRVITRGKKKENADTVLKCDSAACEVENISATIKCNACGTWVCESCSDVPISKLKPIMGKCNSIFFACEGCKSAMLQSGKLKASLDDVKSVTDQDKEDGDTALLTKIDNLFETKLKRINSHIRVLEEKIDGRIGSPNDEGGATTSSANSGKSYARAVGVSGSPDQIKHAIRDVKNDDKIEDIEIEKRAKNIMIHGAEEVGDNSEDIRKEDEGYVNSILETLGVPNTLESVTRLGKANNEKRRPIKLVMKSKEDKMKVMSNLNKLKGTENDFGKISVTDDYTNTERDEIRRWVQKAQEKSAQDPENIYKVRGDPKNGMRLIWFPKKQ